MANTLQYSCLENPHPTTEKPGRPVCCCCYSRQEYWSGLPFPSPGRPVYRVAKSWTLPKLPCVHRRKTFFACGSSAPVRVEHEGGTAAWLVRTLAAPNVQGHGLPPPQDLWRYQSLFEPLVAGHQKASMASLSPRLCPFRHLDGFLAWGPSLLLRCIRHIEEPPELGSYSIEGHVRHLMGHPGWGPTP